jgi:hypothetical protein
MRFGYIARRAVAAVAAVALSGAAASAAGRPSFSLSSGRVTYKITGKPINGTSVLTWIDKGAKSRQESQVQMQFGDQPMNVKSWSINDGKYMFVWSGMLGKTVTRSEIGKDPSIPGASGLQALGENLNKGKLLGKGTILKRRCDIRQIEGAKVWLWKGIPLKVTSPPNSPRGPVTVVATKVEENVKPAASSFKVPAGYQVRDMKDLMQGGPGGPGGPRMKFNPTISKPQIAPKLGGAG